MVKVRVLGGTPEGSDSLCRTCSRGHIIKGFRATEIEVFCNFFYIEREILFPVFECTNYEDRRLATKSEMEDMAWMLTTRRAGRSVGFVTPTQFRQIQKEQAANDSAASDPAESTE
jgi:hypothetical protein